MRNGHTVRNSEGTENSDDHQGFTRPQYIQTIAGQAPIAFVTTNDVLRYNHSNVSENFPT